MPVAVLKSARRPGVLAGAAMRHRQEGQHGNTMSRRIYTFAGIELDTGKREIRAGDEIKLPSPLVFDTLAYLAQHSERVVSKDELAGELWKNRIVSDSSISQAIRKARAALEECGVDPAIIKTQHGHGFRLDAEIRSYEPAPSGKTALDDAGSQNRARAQGKRWTAIAVALAVILTVAVVLGNIGSLLGPDESLDLLEETQSTLATTDAKVDEVVRLLRSQAALSGITLDVAAEDTIRNAVSTMVESGDLRKQRALDRLAEGDVDGAATVIVGVAEELDEASEASRREAAASWREAGAIYYSTDIEEATRCYEAALRLEPENPINASDLAYTYIRAGRLDEAVTTFDEALSLGPPAAIRADVERGLGMTHRLKGQLDVAESYLRTAYETAEALGDLRQKAKVLSQLGAVATTRGDYETAREILETGVDLANEIGDEPVLANVLNDLAIVMASTEQYAEASSLFRQTYDIYLDRADLVGQSEAIGNLGATALKKGELDEAEVWLLQSVELGERLGARRSIAADLTNLGGMAAQRGRFDEAAVFFDRAYGIAEETGLEDLRLILLVNKGELARERGDASEACRLWREALPPLEAMEHFAVSVVIDHQQQAGCP